jgi:hypothetical protein
MKESGLEELKIVLFVILSLSTWQRNSQIRNIVGKKTIVKFCRVLFEDLRKVHYSIWQSFQKDRGLQGTSCDVAASFISVHEIEG